VDQEIVAAVSAAVDRDRLVETACSLVDVPSYTGEEQACAEHLLAELSAAGLDVTLQVVEEGRANAVGRLPGGGDGPDLMFNGHLDTSYSGREPWLEGPGFKPKAQIRDDVILGLGIMNMKGAVACYVEAARALIDAGVSLSGDLIVAGVAGEIEKAQWGEDFIGPEYRGYGTGTSYLVTHGVIADACILGEPTEEKLALGHFGTVWARVSTSGPFFHTAFATGRTLENSVVRMSEVVDRVVAWIPHWEEESSYRGRPGAASIGAVSGGFPWRASRTPHRTDLFVDLRVPPTMTTMEAVRAFRRLVRQLEDELPEAGITSEVYVTVSGSEIQEDHPLVAAIDVSHEEVTGAVPERDYVRWGSDASTLTKHGVAAVNFGPISSALPGPEGESVPISSLVNMTKTYALTAVRFCGVMP
jgi:acetylornithine deacetylase